jgi:hypothetical protein
MRSVSALVVVLATACGRLAFEPVAAQHDGAMGDADALGDFAPPQPVPALSRALTDDDPTATGDALELYFASERIGSAGGFSDLYVSTRASRTDAWSAPQNVAELNSTDEDQSPGVTADGLTIYSTRRRPRPIGTGSSDMWMATRAPRADAWSTPVFVAELSSAADDFEPQPDETGLRLVLYRDMGGSRDLYVATRASTADSWGAPVLLANVSGVGDERSPSLRDAGRELWFTSDRDSPTAGVHDIYRATRASTGDDFSAGEPVEMLNTDAGDDDPWISPDGRVLIFSTDRDGNPEIYETQR